MTHHPVWTVLLQALFALCVKVSFSEVPGELFSDGISLLQRNVSIIREAQQGQIENEMEVLQKAEEEERRSWEENYTSMQQQLDAAKSQAQMLPKILDALESMPSMEGDEIPPPEQNTDGSVPQTGEGARYFSEERAAQIDAALHQLAEEIRTKKITPPLIMVSQGCSGSSATLATAKSLISGLGVAVYPARKELFKPSKNPLAENATNAAEAILATARAATDANQMLIFKVTPSWFHTHVHLRNAILALQPKIVTVLRGNVLDLVTCSVRDCFDTVTGTSVTGTGTPSKLCFKRRQSDRRILANLDVHELIHTLHDKLTNQSKSLDDFVQDGFGTPEVFTSEELMAFEMDAKKLQQSTESWQNFMSHLGFNFSSEDISRLLEKSAGTYPAPSPHSESIYNYLEVEESLRNDSALFKYFRQNSVFATRRRHEAHEASRRRANSSRTTRIVHRRRRRKATESLTLRRRRRGTDPRTVTRRRSAKAA